MNNDPPIEDIIDHGMRERRLHLAEKFIQYIVAEAGQRSVVESWDVEAMTAVAQLLETDGFELTTDGDESLVTVFANPTVWHMLRDESADYYTPIPATEPNTIQIHDMKIKPDTSLQHEIAIAVHHHAIVPSLPGDVNRPWLIRHENGIVAAGSLESLRKTREGGDGDE